MTGKGNYEGARKDPEVESPVAGDQDQNNPYHNIPHDYMQVWKLENEENC